MGDVEKKVGCIRVDDDLTACESVNKDGSICRTFINDSGKLLSADNCDRKKIIKEVDEI